MNRIHKLLKKHKEIVASLVFVVALCILFISYAFAAIEPIESIIIQSEHVNYELKEEGSWQITKSGRWTGYGKAEATLDVDTTLMTNSEYTDIIFVLDISGSMSGQRLERVKSDTKELINDLLSTQGNKVALITFDTSSRIVSELTHNQELLLEVIDNLEVVGTTNYYQALVNVDSILQNYQKESGRELIVLFLTDGYPNQDTPNQIGEYNYLKQAYPYITINGIQYEMGNTILSPIKEISDNQFVADMKTLHNVLFDASVVPVNYDTYQIIDYVDNDNFTIDSADDIEVSTGSVELTNEDGRQKITWTLDGLESGRGATLTMKLKFQEELLGQGGVYSTNESTEVISKIEKVEEDVTTTRTPILADNYTVIYDGNAPNGCTVSNVPGSLQHSVYETVEISDQIPSCSGYEFKGWKIVTEDVTKINDDYFTMPEKNVEIKAEWSKLSTAKSMDGEIYVAPFLYRFLNEDAVMDNTSSEFVSSNTGINFGSISSDTNGKGVYIRSGTEDNEYPILYFRGDVDNNHVKFANFCWRIVRTTETGGIKLVYDGVPDSNGYCNNTGTDSQIGTNTFSQNDSSPSDVGYMYGARYTSGRKTIYYDNWYLNVGKSLTTERNVMGTTYYYADSVTYSNGTYRLNNPTSYIWAGYYNNLKGKYTCRSSTATSCTSVYYIEQASQSSMGYVTMNNGETYDSLVDSATMIFGNDVTWNGSTYTLVDTVETNAFTWDIDKDSVLNAHKYTCFSNGNTCSTVYYAFIVADTTSSAGNASIIYYMILSNGRSIDDAINEMFSDDNDVRNQSSSAVKNYIDTWYSNNLVEYAEYLEDTVWCNDRSFYQNNAFNKDYVGNTSSLTFGAYGRFPSRGPILECPGIIDSFTVSSENGNGKLTYPVSLLTADELVLSGATRSNNNDNFYLNTGTYWWTLSPGYYITSGASQFFVNTSGMLNFGNEQRVYGIRPSISIVANALVSRGDGTSEAPYELVLE